MTVPGTDGAKMSKSYGNFIDIYLDEKALRKVVMSIKTDSTPLEEPKKTEGDTTFKLYSLVASSAETEELAQLYQNGNFGYGHAKQMLFEKLLDKFGSARTKYSELMSSPEILDQILNTGAEKARAIAIPVLNRLKPFVGF
jgi:tryptophanyl-tRNA synthetase